MASKKTILVRANKTMVDELRFKFPNIPISNLLDISYKTSLLKVEAKLRNEKKR